MDSSSISGQIEREREREEETNFQTIKDERKTLKDSAGRRRSDERIDTMEDGDTS